MKIALFGVLCVAALIVAHFARQEKGCAVFAGWVIVANWLQFVSPWIYAPASPSFILYSFGVYLEHEDVWAISDFLCLVALIYGCRMHWWAPVLWSSYLTTLAMHLVAWGNGLEYASYMNVLDAALLVQIAVLFTIGGGGVSDYLLLRWSRIRGMGHSSGQNAKGAS